MKKTIDENDENDICIRLRCITEREKKKKNEQTSKIETNQQRKTGCGGVCSSRCISKKESWSMVGESGRASERRLSEGQKKWRKSEGKSRASRKS